MAGKRQPEGRENKAADYYKLKIQAVDDLVNANEENSPPVSEKELRKYRSGRLKIHIPDWLKVFLLKFWFAGAVCFFFLWGLGLYLQDRLDLLVMTGLGMGFVRDLLENNALRRFAPTKNAYDRWMMFPRRSNLSLLWNILYSFLLLFCVVSTYQGINTLLLSAAESPEPGTIPLGVEPLFFGLFTALWDLLFLAIRHRFMKIVEDAKRKTGAR